MKKKQIKEIFEFAFPDPMTIKVDDELFGSLCYNLTNYNYEFFEKTIEIKKNNDPLDVIFLDYKSIISIKAFVVKEKLKQIIENASSLETIVPFVLDLPYQDLEIENLLEKKQQKMFENNFERYKRALQKEIQQKIRVETSYLNVESVFNEMVVNILKKKKIECRADFDTFKQELEKSDDLIEKIIKGKEKEIF